MQKPYEDERRSARSKVILAATVAHDGRETGVRILDLSCHGALIAGDSLPSPESHVTLHCGSQTVSGWVTWRNGGQAGLSFEEQVTRHAFKPRTSATSHLVVPDTRKTDFKRPGLRGNQLTAEERAFMIQLMSDHAIQAAA